MEDPEGVEEAVEDSEGLESDKVKEETRVKAGAHQEEEALPLQEDKEWLLRTATTVVRLTRRGNAQHMGSSVANARA